VCACVRVCVCVCVCVCVPGAHRAPGWEAMPGVGQRAEATLLNTDRLCQQQLQAHFSM